MKTDSIFTRVLALVLCMIMVVSIMTACYHPSENDEIAGDIIEEGSTDDFITVIKPGTVIKPTVTDPNHIYAGSTELADNSLILGTLTNDVVIGDEEGIAALIPADVKVDVGATSLALSIKNVEDNGADFGDAELLNNLDVHISGVALDNKTPMTVKLGAILPIGLANTELKLYHHENGEAVLMTRVNSASDFAIHNQYVYNEETGEVTIYVASFSVFSAVKSTASKLTAETVADTSWYDESKTTFTLSDAADFIGFRNLVDAGTTFAGKTVKLGVDIDLNNINFDPIGYGYTYNKDSNTAFMGTFDGQNHTIYNLYQQGWDLSYSYSTAGGGLFASIEGSVESPAVIKNLAMSGANIVMECIDMGIVVGYAQGVCHFENIVVTNSTIANYNRATGAVVGEVCYGPYGTDTTLGYSHTFKNITVDSSVVVSSLWGSFDTLIGGVIGGKWGDATVKMENVTTAAELDVYSDVTAAYQWYAYRRCGMLIGHTEQNSPKSALNADAPFLTCENVVVYYGDWVNYRYYQFANQDSGTGRNYPWVRAEASPVGNNGAFSNPRYGVPTHTVDGEVITVNEENANTYKTGYAEIKFDQLYGGGQGVYGKADHTGVTTVAKNTKTVYFQNNWNWTNLKLHYWFENGEDRWTTVVDGIDVSKLTSTKVGGYDVYTFEMPAYVAGFKIEGYDSTTKTTHTTEEVTGEHIIENNIYWFVHSAGNYGIATNAYNNADFQTHDIYVIGSMNNWSTTNLDSKYHFTSYSNGKWTLSVTFDVTTKIKLYNKLVVSDGYAGWINKEGTTDDVELAPGKYTITYSVANNTFTFNMTERIIYLKANHASANWDQGGAWFAAWVWGSSKADAWYRFESTSESGIYKITIPADATGMKINRMSNVAKNPSWTKVDGAKDGYWNQTGNIDIGAGSLFTITQWDGQTTGWSKK